MKSLMSNYHVSFVLLFLLNVVSSVQAILYSNAKPFQPNGISQLRSAITLCLSEEHLDSDKQDCTSFSNSNKNTWKTEFANQPQEIRYYYGHMSTWDVSQTGTDWQNLFKDKKNMNLDIGLWDSSGVTNMGRMFQGAEIFNQDISNWDVSNVVTMTQMFEGAENFNHDIGSWTTVELKHMTSIFKNAKKLSYTPDNWDISKVIDLSHVFNGAENVNGVLNWDTSKVTSMESTFESALAFNQDLIHVPSSLSTCTVGDGASANDADCACGTTECTSVNGLFCYKDHDCCSKTATSPPSASCTEFSVTGLLRWNMGKVTTMKNTFKNAAAFNGEIKSWPVYSVVTMESMLEGATAFNKDVSTWNVQYVNSLARMFKGAAAFNQNLGTWNVAEVTTMREIFSGATSFDGELAGWNVKNVKDFGYMFYNAAAFNQPMASFNTSLAENMDHMFAGAELFDQNINTWTSVMNVNNMDSMFFNARKFNSPLFLWVPQVVTTMRKMFQNSNFNQALTAWASDSAYGGSVSTVLDMESMFENTNFNQNIENWDVSSVRNFKRMFMSTPFNQDISSWPVDSGEKFDYMFRLNYVFAHKDALDASWPTINPQTSFYPGKHMWGKVVHENICNYASNYVGSSTCIDLFGPAAGVASTHPLYDFDWYAFGCDDNGATFTQGQAPYINKMQQECCSSDGSSRCPDNVKLTGYQATDYRRMCMDTSKYKPEAQYNSELTCDAYMNSQTMRGKPFAEVNWLTYDCGDVDNGNVDVTSFHEDIIAAGALCCDTGASRCDKCSNKKGVAINSGPCVCGLTTCTDDSHFAVKRWKSTKLIVDAHKGNGAQVGNSADNRLKTFRVISGVGNIEFSNKDDDNFVAVDFGPQQEESIVRAHIHVKTSSLGSLYTAQVEYADDIVGEGLVGVKNDGGVYAKWDTTFKNTYMTAPSTNTFSDGDLTYTGGDAAGGGMPVSNMVMDRTSSWYVEVTVKNPSVASQEIYVGVHDLKGNFPTKNWPDGGISLRQDGKLFVQTTDTTYGTPQTWWSDAGEAANGCTIGIYYDVNDDSLSFYKDGEDLGNGSPAFVGVGDHLSTMYVYGFAGKSTDVFTLNSGASPFMHYPTRTWTVATTQTHALSNDIEYISWSDVGAHRYWRVVFTDWDDSNANTANVQDLVLGTEAITGLYCSESASRCQKTALNEHRSLCFNPEKYMGLAMVDVADPEHPMYPETCDTHLSKTEWSGVTWSTFSCNDTPKNLKALEFMGVAGQCCSDGRTACWNDYDRICSLAGRSVGTQKRSRATTMTTNGEDFVQGVMVGCYEIG